MVAQIIRMDSNEDASFAQLPLKEGRVPLEAGPAGGGVGAEWRQWHQRQQKHG